MARPTTAWRPGSTDWYILGSTVILAATLALDAAVRWPASYDEVWHLFTAGLRPWRQLFAELAHEAHPPLAFLMVRPLVSWSSALWLARLSSVIPSVATVVVLFLLARRLRLTRPACHLTALLFAVSHHVVSLAASVRAYSLVTFLMLISLHQLLAVVLQPDQVEKKGIALLFAALAIAFWTSYAAIIFIAAYALAPLCLGAAGALPARRWLVLAHGTARRILCGAFVIAIGAGVCMRFTQEAEPLRHVQSFLPRGDERWWQFVLRGVASDLSYFTPLAFAASAWFALALAAILLGYLWLLRRYLRPGSSCFGAARGLVLIVLFLIGACLVALALARQYPFGGKMRHQFVLYPFLLLAAMFVVDEILVAMRGPRLRIALCLAIEVGIAASAAVQAHAPSADDHPEQPLWQREVDQLQRRIGVNGAVYLTQFSLFGFFANTMDWSWTHVRDLGEQHQLFVARRGHNTRTVIRDRQWYVPDPVSDEFLLGLARLMGEVGLNEVWLFAAGHDPDRAPTGEPDVELAARCQRSGLRLADAIDWAGARALRLQTSARH
ncbi:MAG: hypothetical protein U1E76_22195 [Planctomycetota bacterium]